MTPKETEEVAALYAGLQAILDTEDWTGNRIGDCAHGVYLFYDYDGEPIYVGQTREKLRSRIRRHLTNQRTDAVAMSVLDPFEVAEIELWPFWELDSATKENVIETLNRAEFTVYQQAIRNSEFNFILNENDIPDAELVMLPSSIRAQILTSDDRRSREHPDIRLARRARTIANLARIISERKVRTGIRRTLWVQAQRLELLAKQRLDELHNQDESRETPDDET